MRRTGISQRPAVSRELPANSSSCTPRAIFRFVPPVLRLPDNQSSPPFPAFEYRRNLFDPIPNIDPGSVGLPGPGLTAPDLIAPDLIAPGLIAPTTRPLTIDRRQAESNPVSSPASCPPPTAPPTKKHRKICNSGF